MDSDRSFVGEKLRLARLAGRFTQGELGDLVGASGSSVSQLEGGKMQPSETLVGALAEVLGFDEEFFYEDLQPRFDAESINFRHRASTPETVKNRVAAKATFFLWVASRLDSMLEFPPFSVPVIEARSDGEIEAAAAELRRVWGLGTGPISNMIRVAENHGLVVTEFEEADKIDAFSGYQRDLDLGIIFLNTSKGSTSRSRFNVAHEIGHLVLHRGRVTGTKETERQADEFAAAFLMPAETFGEEFRAMHQRDWAHLFELKRRWKVAVSAIIRRAYDLELIGPAEYRRRFKYLSARGWRTGEPQEPPAEPPELLEVAADGLERRCGQTMSDLAHLLKYRPHTLQQVSGLAVADPMPENVADLQKHRFNRGAS